MLSLFLIHSPIYLFYIFYVLIRLGGLLSAHVLSGYLQEHYSRMPWYKGELLNLAFDLGYRLLPAFNTTTGIPHSKVNLMHGLRSQKLSNSKETCTACAGTMILEFAALSRLTGDPIFEEKAHKGARHHFLTAFSLPPSNGLVFFFPQLWTPCGLSGTVAPT